MQDVPNNIKEVIIKLVNRVYILLGKRVKKVVLYGSYARGDYNSNSDIDIMFLTDLSDIEIIEYRDKISDIAYDIEEENNFDISISPLVKNIDKFNYWLGTLPFYNNVQKEGVDVSEYQNVKGIS